MPKKKELRLGEKADPFLLVKMFFFSLIKHFSLAKMIRNLKYGKKADTFVFTRIKIIICKTLKLFFKLFRKFDKVISRPVL